MFRSLSLRVKVASMIAALLVVVSTLVGSTLVLLAAQTADGLVVNIAGRQRMLSQKMTKESLQLLQEGVDRLAQREQIAKTAALFDKSLSGLRNGDVEVGLPRAQDATIIAQLDKVAGIWKPFHAEVKRITGKNDVNDPDVVKALAYLSANNVILLTEMNKGVGMMAAAADAKVARLQVVQIVGFGLLLLILGGVWITMSRYVLKPLGGEPGQMERLARAIAAGDLRESRESVVASTGVMQVMSEMTHRLHDMVAAVDERARGVNQAATEIGGLAAQTGEHTQRQRIELEQLATAVNEMTATSQEVARSAEHAAEASREADSATREGDQVVNEAAQVIQVLADATQKAVSSISDLARESENIGGVLEVIRSIADQTNLLALNAAIEAARAGEQGRGFAVVADEVRSLAKRTQDATTEIHQMIERLQGSANTVVGSMTTNSEQASHSVQTVNRARQALQKINQEVARICDLNNQIASAAEEQTAVAADINGNIHRISDAAHEASEVAHRTADASMQMVTLALGQREEIAHFKL